MQSLRHPPLGERIGVISDTHGLVRPEALKALKGVDLILHAGDIGEPDIRVRCREIDQVSSAIWELASIPRDPP